MNAAQPSVKDLVKIMVVACFPTVLACVNFIGLISFIIMLMMSLSIQPFDLQRVLILELGCFYLFNTWQKEVK